MGGLGNFWSGPFWEWENNYSMLGDLQGLKSG